MNAFRLAGDMTHLMSVIVLLLKIHSIKSCAGISLKSQELYALVFASGYLDIFTNFISLYNTIMKLIFLGSSFSIVWYMRHHKIVCRSYDKNQDTFRHYFLVVACLLLVLVINENLLIRSAYRALYILNWIYRYFAVAHYVHWITWIAGLVQTLIYADFFYYYFISWKNNVKLQLPA